MQVHPLESYRKQRGWSQATLARYLDVNRATLNRWERFERQVGRESVPSISRKTGIPARELRPDWAEAIGSAA
jgi:transcriptional regulator with XRE-family HTH domain